MRVCRICEQSLPEEMFYKKTGNSLQVDCKVCAAKRAREYRQTQRDWVGKYKLEKGCEDCGFKAKHPCQLDLDHIEPSTKTYKGSHKSYDAGWSKKRIENELAKCRVLCKNCHALRTQLEGHWKNTYTDISMRQSRPQ